mgnify:FL=1|tara:strand:- start:182 stop:1393 length:1212 start_codon:yes stop_codon:yes gene_type:complete
MKNTHLEHLEDNILNDGSQGGREAIAFLRSLGKMLDQGAADARVTVKWDGAPAIICGRNPENGEFFVGTKSVFNKTNPKIIYAESDVDRLYSPGQLAEKLKASYRYFSTLNIPNVVQGDLLFTDDKVEADIGGETCITFQPNTIVYAVPKDSEIGQRVQNAKIGIVFHTQYNGRTMSAMSASFGNINIQGTQDVFVTSSDFQNASGEANMSAQEKTIYANLVNKTEGSLKQASRFLDLMKTNNMNKFTLNIMFKTFFNRYIREGRTLIGARNTARDFAQYFSDALDKEIATKKMKTTKDKYLELKNKGLKFISDNQQAIYMTVASYMNLQAAKNFMIRKLQKVNTFGTFLKTENGYRVTAPEGFVAIRSGRALKLVDRLEFSRANFTADKNWDKGNPMPIPQL